MRARMTTCLAGPNRVLNVGDEVDGDDAVRFVKAKIATPIVEEKPKETTVRKRKKETRSK